jgi:transposase-like protein
MINFFRKIRKKLADDNKPLKYMRYAVGEILLVVVGILIALQINNWNEYRKDREKEQKVLETLADNLERNSVILHEGLNVIEKLDKSSKIVFDFFEGKVTYHDSIDNHFVVGRYFGVMQGIKSSEGYENYKNVGFDIILSDDIKKNVLHLFEVEYPTLDEYRRLLFDANSSNAKYDIIRNQYFRKNKPINISNLLNSNDMYEMYAEPYRLRSLHKVQLNGILDNTEKVLQLIKDELGEID